jgi:hypothetical protein
MIIENKDPATTGEKRLSQISMEALQDESAAPIPPSDTELPSIHLRIHPITHPGAEAFTKHVPDIGSCLRDAVRSCWKYLYNNETHLIPRNVRSVTIYIRPMGGVAYTTGNWLDGQNKEIHFSAEYIQEQSPERARDEIRGVLVHEMVHVWQHDGLSFGVSLM